MVSFTELYNNRGYTSKSDDSAKSKMDVDEGFSSLNPYTNTNPDFPSFSNTYGGLPSGSGGGGGRSSSGSISPSMPPPPAPEPTPAPSPVYTPPPTYNPDRYVDSPEQKLQDALRYGTAGDVLQASREYTRAGYTGTIDVSQSYRPPTYVDASGQPISIAPSIVEQQRYLKGFEGTTFINEQGQGFSANPDLVATGTRDVGFGFAGVTYASGRKENVYTGVTDLYGRDVPVDSPLFSKYTLREKFEDRFPIAAGQLNFQGNVLRVPYETIQSGDVIARQVYTSAPYGVPFFPGLPGFEENLADRFGFGSQMRNFKYDVLTAPRYLVESPLFFSYFGGKIMQGEPPTKSEIFTAAIYALPFGLKAGEKALSSVKLPRLFQGEFKFFEEKLTAERIKELKSWGVTIPAIAAREALIPERNLLVASREFFNTKLTQFGEAIPGVDFIRTEAQFIKTEGTFATQYARLSSRDFGTFINDLAPPFRVSPGLFYESQRLTPPFYEVARRGAIDAYDLYNVAPRIRPAFYDVYKAGASDVYDLLQQKAVTTTSFVRELTLGKTFEYGVGGYLGYEAVTGLASGRLKFSEDILRPIGYGMAGERSASFFFSGLNTQGEFIQAARITPESILKGDVKYGTYESLKGVKFPDLEFKGYIKPGTAAQEIALFRSSPFTLPREFSTSQARGLNAGFNVRPDKAPDFFVIAAGSSELAGQYGAPFASLAFGRFPNRTPSYYRFGGLFPNVVEPSIERVRFDRFVSGVGRATLSKEQVEKSTEFLFRGKFALKDDFVRAQEVINRFYGQGTAVVPRLKSELEYLITGGSLKTGRDFYTVIPSEAKAKTRDFFFRQGRQEAYERVPSFRQAWSEPLRLKTYFETRTSNIFKGTSYKPGQFYSYGFKRGEGFPTPVVERQIVSRPPGFVEEPDFEELFKTPPTALQTTASRASKEVGSFSSLSSGALLSSKSSSVVGSLLSPYSKGSASKSGSFSSISSSDSSVSSSLRSSVSSVSGSGSSSISGVSSLLSSSKGSSSGSSRPSLSRGSYPSRVFPAISGTLLFNKSPVEKRFKKSKRPVDLFKLPKSEVYILPDLRSVSVTEQELFGRGFKDYQARTPRATTKVVGLASQAFKGYSSGFIPTEQQRKRMRL